jgi:hypothetical protein
MRPSRRCTRHINIHDSGISASLNPLKHGGVPHASTINRSEFYTQRYVFGVILKSSIDFVNKVYQLIVCWDRDGFCEVVEELLHTDIMQKENFLISISVSPAS